MTMEAHTENREVNEKPWEPPTPLQTTVMGQIIVGIPEALILGILIGIWSALTHLGLNFDQVTGISILTVLARKTLDTAMIRLIMRARRSPDYKGAAATVISFVFAPIAAAASVFFIPTLPAALYMTGFVCLFFIIVICLTEKPWNTSVSYEELKERGRKVRIMTREHFAEEIADGRMNFRPIDDEGYYLDEDGNRIED